MTTTKIIYGTKHLCTNLNCLTKFFDLNKETPACPKCKQKVVPVVVKTRAKRVRR